MAAAPRWWLRKRVGKWMEISEAIARSAGERSDIYEIRYGTEADLADLPLKSRATGRDDFGTARTRFYELWAMLMVLGFGFLLGWLTGK